jgi:hypothetical protein
MYKFKVLVRPNSDTCASWIVMYADSLMEAQNFARAQYGYNNVLNATQLFE